MVQESIGLTESTPSVPDPRVLIEALRAFPATRQLVAGDLVPLRAKGVNHEHIRLRATGLLLRLPRATPWLGDPAAQLALEAAAFRRAEPARVTPRLIGVIETSADLPLGGLMVEDIGGRVPQLPRDLDAIAEALAKLHGLSLPPRDARPPLPDHSGIGPIAATFAVIARQRSYLERIQLAAETIAALEEECAWAARYAAETKPETQPIALVGTDTHPGNFLIRTDGRAALVDLERVCYGSPAIDLAHATLPTSTRWDLDVQVDLTPEQTDRFYHYYLKLIGTAKAKALRPWLLPARRLTWLRTMMWGVRLRAFLDDRSLDLTGDLAAHTQQWLKRFFGPAEIALTRSEWRDGTLRISS